MSNRPNGLLLGFFIWGRKTYAKKKECFKMIIFENFQKNWDRF